MSVALSTRTLALVGGVSAVAMLLALWPEASVSFEPGPAAPDPPVQEDLEETPAWTRDDFLITGLATFSLRAKVLSRERYWLGAESELSPIDLALGWGPMSDQSIVDRLDITQGGRWYSWSADELPLPAAELSVHSANMHLLPASDDVEDVLLDVERGEVVELSGYLVLVEGNDGWRWKSSLSRGDVGDGSCEVFWVEQARRDLVDLPVRPR